MEFKINVCERVKFNHEVILDTNGFTERELDRMLDVAERACSLSDVLDSLRDQGCEIIEVLEDSSGDGEIEIDDMCEI